MNIAKRRAASLKGWRTRKRMKAARRDYLERVYVRAFAANMTMPTADDIARQCRWPEYKRRALPLPDFGQQPKRS